jgi:hypothetical protein
VDDVTCDLLMVGVVALVVLALSSMAVEMELELLTVRVGIDSKRISFWYKAIVIVKELHILSKRFFHFIHPMSIKNKRMYAVAVFVGTRNEAEFDRFFDLASKHR